MNKEVWARPVTKVEQFAANEYVAACGWSEKTGNYLFKCDAAGGHMYSKTRNSPNKYVHVCSGWFDQGYHPCGKTHETPNIGDFYDGFIDYNGNGKLDSGEEVTVWLEYSGNSISNGHATKNLNREIWEEKIPRS